MSTPESTSDNPASRKSLADLTLELTPVLDALSSAATDLGGTVVAAVEIEGHLIIRRSLRSRFDVMPRDPDFDAPGPAPQILPAAMTPAIARVLGLTMMQTVPTAHTFRAAGAEIRTRVEDEQAYVLFRFLHLALQHGDGWAREADRLVAEARATIEVRKAEETTP